MSKIVIDLVSSEGNAYVLLSYAKKYAHQLKLDSEKIIAEMTSGDYENLVAVFEKNFNTIFTIIK